MGKDKAAHLRGLTVENVSMLSAFEIAFENNFPLLRVECSQPGDLEFERGPIGVLVLLSEQELRRYGKYMMDAADYLAAKSKPLQ